MTGAKVNYKISNTVALDGLTVKEKKVIQMRLGIGEYDKQHTFNEISKILGHAFPERARQIEAKALRKLRQPMRHCEVLMKEYDYE